MGSSAPTPPTPSQAPTVVLEKGRSERNYWSDLWRYRELFAILAWRDLAVRYKQAVLGVAWAVIRPALTTAIFTFIYSRVAKLPSEGAAPYSIMVFAGMIPWALFSSILSEGSSSLISNANLIGKVYFPRLIIPTATVVVALADAAITFLMLLIMMIALGFLPDWRIVTLPLFVVLGVLASLGPALLMTALNVKYRDFRYIIPFILQFGVYVSPVGFSSNAVPDQWRLLYSLNPVVGAVDGFRWALLRGEAQLYMPGFLLSLGVTAVMLWAGVAYFRRTERTFADLI